MEGRSSQLGKLVRCIAQIVTADHAGPGRSIVDAPDKTLAGKIFRPDCDPCMIVDG